MVTLLPLLCTGNCSTFGSTEDPVVEAGGSGGTTGSGGLKNTGGSGGANNGGSNVGGATGGSGGSIGGAGGQEDASTEAGGQCSYQGSTSACTQCVKASCGTECAACYANAECLALIDCIKACAGDPACSNGCPNAHANGVTDMLDFVGEGGGCVDTKCGSQCENAGTGGSGGTAGAAGAGGTGGSTGNSVEDVCINRINSYRKSVGLGEVTRWLAQEACADTQSQAKAQGAKLDEAACNGNAATACVGGAASLKDFMKACIDQLWGSQYKSVITTPSYTKVACGTYETGGKYYSTQFYHD